MKVKNMILIISVILCAIISFANPVLADSEFSSQNGTVYIQDNGKNNTANNTGVIEEKEELPYTGTFENFIFVGLAVVCVAISIYSYKKITDYKSL